MPNAGLTPPALGMSVLWGLVTALCHRCIWLLSAKDKIKVLWTLIEAASLRV